MFVIFRPFHCSEMLLFSEASGIFVCTSFGQHSKSYHTVLCFSDTYLEIVVRDQSSCHRDFLDLNSLSYKNEIIYAFNPGKLFSTKNQFALTIVEFAILFLKSCGIMLEYFTISSKWLAFSSKNFGCPYDCSFISVSKA